MSLPRTPSFWIACAAVLFAVTASANPPYSKNPSPSSSRISHEAVNKLHREIDQPNPIDRAQIDARRRLLEQARQSKLQAAQSGIETDATRRDALLGTAATLGKTGTDRVLVILVEFAGTNQYTWTKGTSTWDPFGLCAYQEYDGSNIGNAAASTFFGNYYGITSTNLTYSGPLHNEIARPTSSNDDSGVSIWTPDFSPAFYSNIIFGNGFTFDYSRVDGSTVYLSYTGRSVNLYYEDLSAGQYHIVGDVVGWIQLTNSVVYYGADQIPGRRSGADTADSDGGIAAANDAKQLVRDTLDKVKALYPAFDWAQYDLNSDGVIDRLWIIHAGLGEEDSPFMLYRTPYGEGTMWSHSSSLGTPYLIDDGISANAYIMMPENAGIGVLAHEYAHNLGADDLYAYGKGETSAGFWTLMADDWVGNPLGFQPPCVDPLHLDNWGWLEPLVISEPTNVYSVTLGQASLYPNAAGMYRSAKIELPDQSIPLPVTPIGNYQWWGGQRADTTSWLISVTNIRIPAENFVLSYQAAYSVEANYDWFAPIISTDNGASWYVLNSLWYTGKNSLYPNYQSFTNSLISYRGRDVLIGFYYTTDGSILWDGPFVDNVQVRSNSATGVVLFSDDMETDGSKWDVYGNWVRCGQAANYSHDYYLQWRNVGVNGGYDSSLGGSDWRFGPVNSGLLVWYHNSYYRDNETEYYLTDGPGFGPKGMMLVVDSHPEPDRDPAYLAAGYSNEHANVWPRSLMRDAPFGRQNTADFTVKQPYITGTTNFSGREAVSQFSDAISYFPGLEQVALEPGHPLPRCWMTVNWTCGVILPSTTPCGVKAAGYPSTGDVYYIVMDRAYIGTNMIFTYETNRFAGGLGYNGGTGNPGDANGAYGWNALVVYQTDTMAQVVIWNSRYSHLDNDGDGVENWLEAICGTDASDDQSYLRMSDASPAGNPGIVIHWASESNRLYRLARSASLFDGFATTVTTNIPSTPPVNTYTDTTAGAIGSVFYRVNVE